MTLEELIGAAEQAAGDGALFEMPGAEALNLLETLRDQEALIDNAWIALGIDPPDAPGVGELAEAIAVEVRRARQRGRDEARLAVMACLRGIASMQAASINAENAILALGKL